MGTGIDRGFLDESKEEERKGEQEKEESLERVVLSFFYSLNLRTLPIPKFDTNLATIGLCTPACT
jgi:hypothetical protein